MHDRHRRVGRRGSRLLERPAVPRPSRSSGTRAGRRFAPAGCAARAPRADHWRATSVISFAAAAIAPGTTRGGTRRPCGGTARRAPEGASSRSSPCGAAPCPGRSPRRSAGGPRPPSRSAARAWRAGAACPPPRAARCPRPRSSTGRRGRWPPGIPSSCMVRNAASGRARRGLAHDAVVPPVPLGQLALDARQSRRVVVDGQDDRTR